MGSFDRVDLGILKALQLNARITNAELASRVSLSESACLRRVRALEAAGLIEGYFADINAKLAGFGVSVFVSIKLERQDQAQMKRFEAAVKNVPEILECYLLSGEYDYLLRVVMADMSDFERLHTQELTRLPHVARMQSSFNLRTVQRARALPLR